MRLKCSCKGGGQIWARAVGHNNCRGYLLENIELARNQSNKIPNMNEID